ncbi:predicted protein [Uncinocarpus reesii 1704]|uniref:Protein kinase domain-containing protein n=1 Tax=Uncinocarpus reesii (strain UAMH 1704) TaxID=336963 RepID=C4JFS4_UNCRE|nr:uncharacterized protein UREG_02408 [Uncinocarpus reesii 1704]EEP77559.1 predicted protein [Uncinocarpus reesii 1704]
MAISIADTAGPFLDPILPMPNLKKSAPVKQSFLHRLGLRKWLAKESHRQSHSPATPPSPPVPFPLAAPPPPIEPPPPIKRPSHASIEFNDNRDEKFGTSPPQRRSVNNINLEFSPEATFSRQESERRELLTPNEKTDKNHRRAVSADHRRPLSFHRPRSTRALSVPRSSVPELAWDNPCLTPHGGSGNDCFPSLEHCNTATHTDAASANGEDFERVLQSELDKKWILNLSMGFRDRLDREKFFITYAESPNHWRRVTVSCDYRDAEPESLERDLKELRFHRDKNARIYESIRESIDEIEFYDTVTNLRLETREGRLHVHVTEDVNEIIPYPPISSVAHLSPPLIPESHIAFHSHLSGFVYHVKLNGENYVKKEITGPDTVEEFLYEINALHALLDSDCVIQFKGILVDDSVTVVKGLLLDFASQGSLADLFFDYKGNTEWTRRERWARQIIKGLADIHEAGFVQGDFTVSNVVVDEHDNAKIIDINRRGCPIGWEPPEFTKKIESKQRISMYIGVKSDLFQLGMTLWAMAMEEDEPGTQPRPLTIPSDSAVPEYFQNIIQICLSPRPQNRLSAKELLSLFPKELPNPVTEELLEYPEQDSGNFITTQKLHSSDMGSDVGSPSQAALLHPVKPVTNSDFSLHDSPGPESELNQDPLLPLPPDDLYNLEGASLSAEPTNSHIVLDDVAQYELGGDIRNQLAFQSALFAGSPPCGQELWLDPLAPASQTECPRIFAPGAEKLPELLTGVGDHMLYSFPNSLIPRDAKVKTLLTASETDVLSEKANSDINQEAPDNGDLNSDACREAIADSFYTVSADELLLSRLPINPALANCSTIGGEISSRNSASNESRIPDTQPDTQFLPPTDVCESVVPVESSGRHRERPPLDNDSLIMSLLPINPACDLARPSSINPPCDAQISTIPSSPCIKIEPDFPSSASFIPLDDLFTSALPLNPAHLKS